MDPTHRFSDRVADYVRYRPGYPPQVLDVLRGEAGLATDAVVADIGSGTGLSAELFLAAGHVVYGIEPNRAMRGAAEERFSREPRFHSIAGSAEETTLPECSIDLVVAGQAFHWFNVAGARREFLRVLRLGGSVVLLWNTRRTDATPFLRALEALLLKYGTDYREVNHANLGPAVFGALFGSERYQYRTFPNAQSFDLQGLRGRLLSSSYVPPPGHPTHAPLFQAAEAAFRQYAENGRVRFEYVTEMYFGALTG